MGDLAVDVAKAFSVRLDPAATRPAKARLLLLSSEVHCVACYRFGRFARRLRDRHRLLGALAVFLHHIWNRWVTHIDGADLSRDAQIGPGLLLMHCDGIHLGPSAIGANCTLHHNVTIGQGVVGINFRAVPSVGRNVWIGPGSILTGSITIGDGVTISAGTVLSKSVSPGCLVGGNPGRVIAQHYDNGELLGFDVDRR
ncbi:MAG: hypothetical protein WCA30_15080 [Dermatophilaceae bacterium]